MLQFLITTYCPVEISHVVIMIIVMFKSLIIIYWPVKTFLAIMTKLKSLITIYCPVEISLVVIMIRLKSLITTYCSTEISFAIMITTLKPDHYLLLHWNLLCLCYFFMNYFNHRWQIPLRVTEQQQNLKYGNRNCTSWSRRGLTDATRGSGTADHLN